MPKGEMTDSECDGLIEKHLWLPHVVNCLCFRDKPPAMQHPGAGEDPGCLLMRGRARALIRAAMRMENEACASVVARSKYGAALKIGEPSLAEMTMAESWGDEISKRAVAAIRARWPKDHA